MATQEYELETTVLLSDSSKFKVKISDDKTVEITITGRPGGLPDVTHNWTFKDLRIVNSANRPLIEAAVRLTTGATPSA